MKCVCSHEKRDHDGGKITYCHLPLCSCVRFTEDIPEPVIIGDEDMWGLPPWVTRVTLAKNEDQA